jgi:hypothetical protein
MPDFMRLKLTISSREPNPTTDSLTPYFLFEAGEEKGICLDFLQEAVSRFEEDDTVKSMITKAMKGLSLQLSNMTMNDNYKPYINVRQNIVTKLTGDDLLFIGSEIVVTISSNRHSHRRRPPFPDGGISSCY